jgi:hypothetical protein
MYMRTQSLGAAPERITRDPRRPRSAPQRKLHCGRNVLPGGRVVTIDCSPKPPWRGGWTLGAVNPCGDANQGLLSDCLRSAGVRLSGYRFTGLGSDLDASQLFNFGWPVAAPAGVQPIAMHDVQPPDPNTIARSQLPSFLPMAPPPVLPAITAENLRRAALLPNAPAIVRAAAANLPDDSSSWWSTISSWFQGQMISGVPNYLVAGGSVLLILGLVGVGGRRR